MAFMHNTSITRFAQSVVSVANETAGKVGCMHLLDEAATRRQLPSISFVEINIL